MAAFKTGQYQYQLTLRISDGGTSDLIVSSVSLYSWHEQSSQIRYSLDKYFPRIHSAFLIEGNLNLVVDQLNEFLQAPNTTVRLQLRTQIIQHLDTIERLSRGLSSRERQQLTVILQDSRSLLSELIVRFTTCFYYGKR